MPDQRLGCVTDLQIFVTDRCSAPRLCELTNMISVQWNRKLDAISEATVVVALSDPECCECMADIEPWCHMLHIIRNGEIVWQGPIVRITYGFEKVTIEAKDILAFLQVTVPETPLDNSVLFPKGREITDIAVQVLNIGFVTAGRDDCFLSSIFQMDLIPDSDGKTQRPTLFKDTFISPNNGFKAFEGTIFDWFTILAENGLDYTVIGLSIILAIETTNLPRLGVLTDDNILGEIEVTKDGSLMANRVFVRYSGDDQDTTCAAQCGADHSIPTCASCNATGFIQPCFNNPCPAFSEVTAKSCYGNIDRLFNNGEVGNHTTAKQTADAYVKEGSVAPRTIQFPGGTKLSPDTPWGINDMIPGQKIDVALTEICLDELQSFRLLELDYSIDSGNDESISISLGPFNQITGTS